MWKSPKLKVVHTVIFPQASVGWIGAGSVMELAQSLW
jgi:hypothetical protein